MATRRVTLGAAGIAVLAAAAALVVWGTRTAAAGDSDTSGTTSGTAAADTATATVTRTDLVRTETLTGSISFGEPRDVTSASAGIVTSVAEEGAELGPGSVLFAVDTEPTVLLTGSVPAYRELSQDSEDGADITQLEQALVDLGFGDGVTVDTTFDAATADAVQSWEESLGRGDPDGVVALGDIRFVTGTVRISEVVAPVGAQVQSGGTVLRGTSAVKQVDLDVEVDRADDIAVGTAVGLELPDGTETTGTVADVGTTPQDNTADPTAPQTLPVIVSVDDQATVTCCTSGAVDVVLERSRDAGVLAVPVSALLALAEGGYAVEVVEGSSTRLVAVDPGTYTDDLVAVTGVDEGTEVVVAR